MERFEIYDSENNCVFKGTIIGFSRIAIFDAPVTTDALRIVITESRNEPYIACAEVFKTGAYRPKK